MELSPGLQKRLAGLVARYEELGQQMSDPEVTGDRDRLRAVGQEYRQLEPIVETITELRRHEEALAGARELIAGDDADMRDLAREEEGRALARIGELTDRLRHLLIPRDTLDEQYVINEIPGG